MDAFIIPAAQLGGTVFTVCAFLWYLTHLLKIQIDRDNAQVIATNHQAETNIKLATSLQRLSDIVERNTQALKEQKPKIEENTGALGENTGAIKNGNGH